jgi:hypothetical protein
MTCGQRRRFARKDWGRVFPVLSKSIPLLWIVITPLSSSAQDRNYWIDPGTHLMWAATDNGSGVGLSQAKRYCGESNLGGFKDWRLPSIEELQQIFGGSANQNGRQIKGPIKLTGWEWSSTPGEQEGEGWALDFGDGAKASVAAGDSGLNRALCVRRQ